MTRRARDDQGFTLVELLVALALAGLLFAAMAGMVRTAARSWDGAARATERAEALIRLDRTLRRQLSASVPAGALGTVAGRPPLFFGAQDGFGWVARTPSEAAGPGLFGQRVRLDGDKGLILESWPLDRPTRVSTAPLGPADTKVAFAYFGALTPGVAPDWKGRWPAGPIPPRLVRLRYRSGRNARDLVYPVG